MATPHQEDTFRRNLADRINLNITPNDSALALNFELTFVNFKQVSASNEYVESDVRIPRGVPTRGTFGATTQYANVRIFRVSFERINQDGNLSVDGMPAETNKLGKRINKHDFINCVSGSMDEILNHLNEIAYFRVTLHAEVRTRYPDGTLGPKSEGEFHFYIQNHNLHSLHPPADLTNYVLLNTNAFIQLYELANEEYNIGAAAGGDRGYFPPLNEIPDVNILDKQYRTVWFRFFSEDDYLYCETLNRYPMSQPNLEYDSVNAKRTILGYDEHGNKQVEFDIRNMFRTRPQQLGSDELHSKREIFMNGGIPRLYPIFNDDLESIFEQNGVLALGVARAVEGDVKKLVKTKGMTVEKVRLDMNPNELYWKWIRFRPEDFGLVVLAGKVINVAGISPGTCASAPPVPDAEVHVLEATQVSPTEYTLITGNPVLTIPVKPDGTFKVVVHANSFPKEFVLAAKKTGFERSSTSTITVNTTKKSWGFNFDLPCGQPDNVISGKGLANIVIPLDSSTADSKDDMPYILFEDKNKKEPLKPADKPIPRTDYFFKIKSKNTEKKKPIFRKPVRVKFGVFLFDSAQRLHNFTPTNAKWGLHKGSSATPIHEYDLNTLSDEFDVSDIKEFKKYRLNFKAIVDAVDTDTTLKDMTLYGLIFDCDNNVFATGLNDLDKLMKELNYVNLHGPDKFRDYCKSLRKQRPARITALFDYDRAIVKPDPATSLEDNKTLHKLFVQIYKLFKSDSRKTHINYVFRYLHSSDKQLVSIINNFFLKNISLLRNYFDDNDTEIISCRELNNFKSTLNDILTIIESSLTETQCINELKNYAVNFSGPRPASKIFTVFVLDNNLENPRNLNSPLMLSNILAFYLYLYEKVNGDKFKP